MSDTPRLAQLRKFLGMTQKQMAEILQIGQNAYSMIENGKIRLTEKNRSILSEKLRANPLWLETGIGDMFLDQSVRSGRSSYTDAQQNQGVPYYSKPVTGPISISFNDAAQESPEYNIDYKPFNDCSFYRPVYGESMCPKFNPGDVIACKRVISKELILYGESYLCMIKIDSNFYETIKVLRRHADRPDMIILKPINTNFDESIIPIDSIVDLYIIKGKIERNI